MKRGSSGLNLLLAVDKPAGMTSHDVVDRVRRALGERRVGHAGTLDPAATGVMVVGVGQGTRLMGLLTADTKSYVASIRFGTETNTDDAEGEVTRSAPIGAELADEARARDLLAGFLGEQDQVPPAFSAISVGGKRSYARARKGEQFDLPARRIEVLDVALVAIVEEGDVVEWQCAFTVSKGTYIRALARDIGRRAGSAAHLSRLVRTSSGGVTLASCTTIDDLFELGQDQVADVALDPVRALGLPTHELSRGELKHVLSGRALALDGAMVEGQGYALVHGTRLMGVWDVRGGRLRPRVNFDQGIEGVR